MMGRKLGVGMASKVMAEVGNEFIAKEFGNMAKQKQIHVLADETLGGIKREYVETNRKAEVGDYIVTHFTECFSEGKAYEVIFENCGEIVVLDDEMEEHILSEENYRTLEPTDIVRLRDENAVEQRFRLVDRKAEVGERVLVKMDADADEHNLGKVYEVIGLDGELVDTSGFYDDESTLNLIQSDYYVLVPVESESSPQSTDDIIANLVRRVAELERRDEEHRHVIERMGLEVDAVERSYGELFSDVKRDIETWTQEVEKVRRTADTAEANLEDLATRQRDHLRRLREMERRASKKITLDAEVLAKLIGGDVE